MTAGVGVEAGGRAQEADGSAALFAALYADHYGSLLRLAALLLDEVAACEDVVQEAFLRVHGARLRDPDRALAYLRQTVVNLSRSALRRRLVALRHLPRPAPDAAPADEGAYAAVERAAVVRALRALPRRQREAVVLRFWGDLSETQAAEVLGVSVGSIKGYTSRGLAALTVALEELR